MFGSPHSLPTLCCSSILSIQVTTSPQTLLTLHARTALDLAEIAREYAEKEFVIVDKVLRDEASFLAHVAV